MTTTKGDPALTRAVLAYARFLRSLSQARARARELRLALEGRGGSAYDPARCHPHPLHPSGGMPADVLAVDALDAEDKLRGLHRHYLRGAPLPALALAGEALPEGVEKARALEGLALTRAERGEFGLAGA